MLPEDLRNPNSVEVKFYDLADQMAAGKREALFQMRELTRRCSYYMAELSEMLPVRAFFLMWEVMQAIRVVWDNLGGEDSPGIPRSGTRLLDEFLINLGLFVQMTRNLESDNPLCLAINAYYKLIVLCNVEGKKGFEGWLTF